MCFKNKKKRKTSRLKRRHNSPETVSTNVDLHIGTSKATATPFRAEPSADMTIKTFSETAPLEIEALLDSSVEMELAATPVEVNASVNMSTQMDSMKKLNRSKKKRMKRNRYKESHNPLEHDHQDHVLPVSTNVDLHVVTSKTMAVPFRAEPSADMIIKTFSEAAPFEIEALGDTSMKMELAAAPFEVNASVNTSTQMDSIKKLSQSEKKSMGRERCKESHNSLEQDYQDHILPVSTNVDLHGVTSKTMAVPFRAESSADMIIKAFSETTSLEIEALSDTITKMVAAPIEVNASVNTSTQTDSIKKLSRSEKKKMRRERCEESHNPLEHDDQDRVLPLSADVDLHIVTSKATAAPSRAEPSADMIIKTFSDTTPLEIEALGDTSTKMELAAAPVEVNASVNMSTQTDSVRKLSRSEKKRMRRKRSKESRNPLEQDDQDHVLPLGNSLRENIFLGKDSSLQPSGDMCSKNELVMKQPNGDICFFSDHKSSVNNRVVNLQIVNGMHLDREDLKLSPTVSESDLTNVKEDLLMSEKQSCSSKSAMEKHDVPTENDLVSSKTNNICMYKRKKVIETFIRKERKRYSYSSVHCLDCIGEDARHVSVDRLMKNVSVPPERHLEQKDREKLDEIQITMQDASHGDGISDEIPSDPKEDNTSGHDACCKHPEKTVEVKTKMAEIFPSSDLGVMKDDVVLEGTGNTGNLTQNLQFSRERACIGHSKKKLLVLDVNGLLAHIVSHPSHRKPDIMVSMKAVYKRPYSDDFLLFCFERFNVGVWSSRVKKNLDTVVDYLLGDSRQNLLFCWDASQCSTTGLNTIENHRKPLVLKELKKLWEKLEPNLPWEKGEYNETNTLLLDDTPYKALCNPAYTAVFPYPYDHRDANDFSLGPGGDLRVYLEGLAVAENVQEYVRQNPFGQRALTESHPSWNFYRKVFLVKTRPPHYDGNREIIHARSCEPCE